MMNISIAVPAIISFLVTIAMGPALINYLHKLKFGQFVRDCGPESHQKKSGTPTMGGLLFLAGMLVGCILFIPGYPKILPVLFMTFGFGLVGFLDDYIKVVKKRNLGLTSLQKIGGQVIVTACFAFYMVQKSGVGTAVLIPFTGGQTLDLGMLYIPALFFIVLGTVNGANFTDGLDGLASSVTTVIALFLLVTAAMTDAGFHPVIAAMIGALLGFLCFNTYPAKVFMGDTGSLALGGFVVAVAYMLNMPLYLPIIAFIYFIEVLSVIIQVLYFKKTRKRVFRMAPIHHHYELGGWPETKVVAIFTIVTAVLCIAGFLAY